MEKTLEKNNPRGRPVPPAGSLQSWEEWARFFLSPAANHKGKAGLFFGAVLLMLFARILFSGSTLVSMADGDLANQFYGWRQFGFSELAKGHLALWNPYLFCGSPYFAGFQSALLYPPNWLFMVLPLAFALNFSIAFHIFLAGFFTYLWMASNRLCFLAALFGSFIFMFGGSYFSHIYPGHLSNLCTMAWIPLVFLSVEGLLESPSLSQAWKTAGILSLQLLSGHAQYFIYTLLIAGLYAAFLIFWNPALGPRKMGAGVSSLFLALGVTAIQWLPALGAQGEYGRDFSASEGSLDFFSLHPLGLVSLFTPGLSGNPSLHSCWINSRIWWESNLFIGTTAFLFALNALRRPGKEDNWMVLGLALFSLGLSLGPATPLYPLLERLPLFHSFRGSFKFSIFFQAFAALLAARGFKLGFGRAIPIRVFLIGPLDWPCFRSLPWPGCGMAEVLWKRSGLYL